MFTTLLHFYPMLFYHGHGRKSLLITVLQQKKGKE